MQAQIRVILVDAQAMFCDGVRAVLLAQPDIVVLGDAVNAEDAMTLVNETPSDIMILDADLPKRGAVNVIRQVEAMRLQTAIIVLVAAPAADLVQTCIGAGAQGCLMKTNRIAVLLDTIRSVATGGAVVDPVLANLILTDYRRRVGMNTQRSSNGLDPRDLVILQHLTTGATSRDIAQKLSLSPQTIKNRLSAIYRNLGVKNRSEAVAMATRQGLVQID